MALRARRRALPLLVACALAALAGWLLWRAARPDALDRSGRAAAPTPAGDLLAAPSLAGLPRATPAPQAGAVPAQPETAPTSDGALAEIPLRVSAFDIHTGRAVAGTWSPRGRPATAAPFSLEQVEDPDEFARAQEQEARNAKQRWADYQASFVALDEAARDPLENGNEIVHLGLGLRLAEGWVPLEPWSLLEPWIDLVAYRVAHAREAVAVLPAAREAPLDVVVLGPDGQAAEGAMVELVELSGKPWSFTAETLGPGRLRVTGLPHLPGEPVTAYVVWRADEDGEAPEDSAEPASEQPLAPQLVTTVPESLAEPWRVFVRLAGPVGDLPYAEEFSSDTVCTVGEDLFSEGEPTGSVRVLAQGWDGRALGEATVAGSPVDAAGSVLLAGLRVGRRTLRMGSPGRLLAVGEVEVVEGREATLLLREPRGGRLEVEVVDVQGQPLPGARLFLDTSWFDVVDGVQRLDLVCDEKGRRTLERVQPGPCRVSARWGSREGTAEAQLRDEETTRVTIVAR